MGRRLAALLLAGLLASPAARAQPGAQVVQTGPRTFDDYLGQLLEPDASDRLFAARELRRRVRRAVRLARRGDRASLAVADALASLDDFDRYLAPRCIEAVEHTERFGNILVPCADILGLLGTREALPALRAAREAETRRRPRRHLDRAVQAIEAADAEAAP